MKKSMTALASLMLVGLMSVPALAVNCPVGDSDEPMVIAPAPTTFGAVPYVSNGTTYVSLDFFKTLMDYQNGSITLDGSTIQINTGK